METRNRPADLTSRAGEKVDVDALRELLKLMSENGLVELEYEFGGLAVRLSKQQAAAPVPAAGAAVSAAEAAKPAAPDEDQPKIVSPMVGTFYSGATPDAPPFVSAGDIVDEDTVVCLIEAMKVFNEIKAGLAGRITKVCAKNEDAVEFGQVLFLVEPA
jgi:acetyl-CoA carboxylase biotin carboxyl carrier protein